MGISMTLAEREDAAEADFFVLRRSICGKVVSIRSADAVNHPSNAIEVAPLFVAALEGERN